MDEERKLHTFKAKQLLRQAERKAQNNDLRLHPNPLVEREIQQRRFNREAIKLAQKSPKLEIPSEMTLTREYVESTAAKRKYNEQYAEYFVRLAEEYDDGFSGQVYRNIAESVRTCYTAWFFDWYRMSRVRDVKSISLCHSKFCSNCQYLLQSSRLKRFTPVLADIQKEYDLYHCVLTVPNVDGEELAGTVGKIIAGFRRVVRYFAGRDKVVGLDFEQYGYAGAVRCLECTIKADSFHPHLHCLLLLRKGLDLPKLIINAYSYDRGIYTRSFSMLEVLIQKLWFLIISGKKVTAEALAGLKEGYSCMCDRIEGEDWHEVFKYVTKLTKDDNKAAVMTYEQFKAMYFALYKRRVMQGYGLLYNVAADGDKIDNEVNELYKKVIGQLRYIEEPLPTSATLGELIVGLYKGDYTCISRLSLQRYLNDLAEMAEED